MGGPRYTPDQLALLRREYKTAPSVRALARTLGRSPDAVKCKALELGLHRPREVEPESPHNALMRAIAARYADAPDLHALAAELGITFGSLKGYAYRLGIKRSREVMHAARVKGGHGSVRVRRDQRVKRATRATPLDAAWRGLQLKR